MALSRLISLVLVCALLSCAFALDAKFLISKHYVEDKTGSSVVPLGKLIIFEEGEVNQAYVQPEYPSLVTAKDLQSTQAVILTFREVNTGQTFTTAVTSSKQTQHSEKILVAVSSREEIIGFNYAQTRLPNQDISVDFLTPDRGVQQVLKAEPMNKPAAQEESFFQKYKWPLIIGGVILYLSMTMNPEKAGQAPQGQA